MAGSRFYTAAGPCSPVRMRITSSTGSTQIVPSPTVPQSWKRRGNGRETNGKRKDDRSRPTPSRLAAEQLAGSVAEVGSADDTFVAIDAQTREGVKEA